MKLKLLLLLIINLFAYFSGLTADRINPLDAENVPAAEIAANKPD